MGLDLALDALYEGLSASEGVCFVSWLDTQGWEQGTLEALIQSGLLEEATKARSVECVACEYRCFKDVTMVQNARADRAFVVCDVPEMQSEMGRVSIPIEYLQRWQCRFDGMARVLRGLLGCDASILAGNSASPIQLGFVKGSRGRRAVNLQLNPLSIDINGQTAPIGELLFFDAGVLSLDHARIDAMLNARRATQGKPYQPSTVRREANKQQTQAMYLDWQDEAARLMRAHPCKSKTWVSQQIAKLSISKDKSARTIYRNMD